jgi:hypothetical protein
MAKGKMVVVADNRCRPASSMRSVKEWARGDSNKLMSPAKRELKMNPLGQ